MLENIRTILFNKRILFLWGASLFINSITLLLVATQGNTSRSVVLHYNIVVGAELFGSAVNLYKLPIIGFFVLGVNTVLYKFLVGKQDFLAEISIFIAFLVSTVLFASTLFLKGIN